MILPPLVDSKWPPVTSAFWYSFPYTIHSPSTWAGPSDYFLTSHRIQKKWWMLLLRLTPKGLWLSSCISSHLLTLREAICQAVGHYGVVHMAGNWERCLDNKEWETEALNSAREELNPASNHMSELRRTSFSTWAFRWHCSPVREL